MAGFQGGKDRGVGVHKPPRAGAWSKLTAAQTPLADPAIEGRLRNSEPHGQLGDGPFVRLTVNLGDPQAAGGDLRVGGIEEMAHHGPAEGVAPLGVE